MPKVINEVFAFTSTENPGGDEGIIAALTPSGVLAPFMSGDMDLLPVMAKHADSLGIDYEIKIFSLDVPH